LAVPRGAKGVENFLTQFAQAYRGARGDEFLAPTPEVEEACLANGRADEI
jgi:hypothetical protein